MPYGVVDHSDFGVFGYDIRRRLLLEEATARDRTLEPNPDRPLGEGREIPEARELGPLSNFTRRLVEAIGARVVQRARVAVSGPPSGAHAEARPGNRRASRPLALARALQTCLTEAAHLPLCKASCRAKSVAPYRAIEPHFPHGH